MKKKAKENERKMWQESQCLLNLQESDESTKGKLRLNFDNALVISMSIDHVPIIVTRTMVKKKKDASDGESDSKIWVVENKSANLDNSPQWLPPLQS